jgi:hypothetical protein
MNKRRTVLAGGLSLLWRNLFGQKSDHNAATGRVSLGYKMAWLAVRTLKTADVVSYLKVQEQRSVTWAQGVGAIYDRTELARATLVFVTPPVKGWTLAAGWWAMGQGDRHSLENIVTIARDLSSTFGEAQGFASYRVVDYYHWILARNGHVERSFGIEDGGDVLANTGSITEAERKLAFWNEPIGQWRPNENDVVTVAAGWSVDPTKLAADSGPAEFGVIGRVRRTE